MYFPEASVVAVPLVRPPLCGYADTQMSLVVIALPLASVSVPLMDAPLGRWPSMLSEGLARVGVIVSALVKLDFPS